MPISVSVIAEHDVVAAGVEAVLGRFPDDVTVVEPGAPVDIALWSTFGAVRLPDYVELRQKHRARRLVVLCWDLEPEMVRRSLAAGADGYISTALSGAELVDAITRVDNGETVVSPKAEEGPPGESLPQWPGQDGGLSEREGDIVALICRGLSNDDVAGQLFLSINTVKSYIRSAYRKMGVSSRSQAVLWGIEHGLRHQRRQHGVDDAP